MIRFDREDYERRVLATLRGELVERDPGLERAGNRIIVEDVRLEGSELPHRVHILFREESRPECLFGFAESAVEVDTDPSRGYWGQPEEYASTTIVTQFMEQVEAVGYGLPPVCDPEGITWANGHHEPIPE